MQGNLKTKQNKTSYNNAVRELNKNNTIFNEYILHKIRILVARELNLITLELQVGGKINFINKFVKSLENNK